MRVNSKGFTLIEVLVVAIVVLLGVTGYVALQSKFIKSDASLNLRSIAMELAQEKLEDLRQFTALESTPGQFAYNDIDDNAGGNINAGNVSIQLKTQAGNTHTFNRSWTVTDQFMVDLNGDGRADTWVSEGDANVPNPLPAYSGQKRVIVSVTYTDTSNEAQSVVLSGNIAPVPVRRSVQVSQESENTRTQPQVAYTPGLAPDVISYELGNGEKIETSKPVPDIDNQGDNNIVQFETIKYIELADQTDKLEQEEFLTVNCQCQLSGIGDGLTAAMTVLEDGKLTTEKGVSTPKMTGQSANNQQPDICDSCCKNHHDTADMVTNETYYRLEAGGPHKHYKRQANGTFSIASSVGDQYDEVCRFKRVDGFFELYTDWQLVDVIEFDDGYLFEGSNLSGYTNYTESVISAIVMGQSIPGKPANRDMTVPPGAYQLIARGIYLDRMKSNHLAEVQGKISAGDSDWKAITPFYDINLTLLASWSSNEPSVATVTQEDIQTIVDPVNNFYGTYSRGRLEALSDGVADITVAAYPFNSSITGSAPISNDEQINLIADDSLSVTVDSKAGSEKFFGLIGDINCLITIDGVTDSCETNNNKKSNFVDLSMLSITPSPNQFACSVTIPPGKSTPFFSCEDVSENWTGDLTFALSKPGYTVTMKIQYPDQSVVQSDTLSLATGLSETSNREYNLIIELVK